ncbi:uncharacterized protein LOC128960471 isoform X2 [Oppia nitens]|uniref:uncharacterized protein LOC128960471 isoform X2 n=1 Tax=Oppia nitens TaxID=1686743 RepID=UPI0023DC8656|nr:uncharacterized protein LOC128960471 isoform X2 [Oppia nitens]
MMSSSIIKTNSDISVANTGINRITRDADNIYITDNRDLSPDNSINSRSQRSASVDSIASIAQQAAHQPSCSSAMTSMDELPTKKRRKQSNPVRYGQTSHQTNILPIALETVPRVDDEEDDDESLIATGMQVSSQLQRSGSFSDLDDDSNDDEDMDEEPSLNVERRKLLQPSMANVINFHKYQYMCPHCNCPFLNDNDLRLHIEEEHVQKILERQLFHQQQLNKSLMNGPNQLRDSLSGYEQNQNKFNSSDSRSASSSSGSNNNSPLQSPLEHLERKSFDGSLPLPHGSNDSNVKEFGSNFLPFQMPPNIPPLISMNQSGGNVMTTTREGSKSPGHSTSPGATPLSLAMFSNPMAPFLFPMMPSGANTGSNGSAMGVNVANGGQQTHKANKHGIYSMDTLVGPQGYGQPFFTNTLSNSSGQSSTAAATAAMQMQQLLQSSAGITPTSEALVVTTPVRSNVINLESYCEICQKEFCNKYFLKKHKQKIHGLADPHNNQSQSSSASPGSCSNEAHNKTGSLSPSSPTQLVPVSTTPLSSARSPVALAERPQQQMTPSMVSSQTSSPTNSFVCEICKQEFSNLITLQTHRFTAHFPTSMHVMAPNLSANLQTIAASQATGETPAHTITTSANRLIVGPVSSITESANFVFTPNKLREMGVINADAFCEICCKEFCNKYFLRTHKINKHGLSFDSNSSTKSQNGPNCGDNKGEDSNNMSTNDNDDSFLEPGQRDPATYSNGSEFFNAMSGINSEMQCELCSRPFGSHYLLKMHKFYSHNIPYIKEEDIRRGSMTASPGAGSEVPNDMKGISESFDTTKELQMRQQESGNGQNDSDSDSDSDSPTGAVSQDQASQDLQKLQSMIKELNSQSILDKTVCNLCRQEFENKYFLRVHMMNDHGVITTDEATPMDSNAFMRNLFEGNRQNFPLLPTALQSADSEAFCDICHREFCSKYFLKTHKQNVHGIYEGPPTPTEANAPSFPQQIAVFPTHRKSTDEAVNLAISPNRNKSQLGVQQMIMSSNKQMPQLSSDGKSRNVTGRNYCNICNKELCNKYFMKTHMLKMHGINIDEHPVEASANSTIGGVTCDICQKELCSKYFLKVHKQNTHGIYEEPPQPKEPRNVEMSSTNSSLALGINEKDPQAVHGIDPNDTNNRYFSHYTEVCPLCERRFKSIKWLKTHMINDHSDIVSMKPTDLSMSGPNAVTPDLSRFCVLCGQNFADRVALHIHLVKDHRTTAEELGISSNMTVMRNTPSATDLSLKSDLLPIGLQMTQHMSGQSQINGSTSPSSQGSTGITAIVSHHNSSHNTNQLIMNNNNTTNTTTTTTTNNNNNNNNNCLNKMISISSNTCTTNTMTSIPTTAMITSTTNPMFNTNISNTDTNNMININNNNNNNNTNNMNTNDNCNQIINNSIMTSNGSNLNSVNIGVITCPTISTPLTSSPSLVTTGNTSPTHTTAVVKEERSPSVYVSSSLSSIISKRTGCGTRIYQCSYCNYSTRWLSNLYAHEKRHTRLNTEADKKFVCRVCHRAYRYNHSLQRHMLNHRSGGLISRDISAVAMLASSSSKGLLSSGLHSNSSEKLLSYDSKLSRLLPSGSLVRPNRVKRYRCSKCNKKFRTRDLCLAHIHVYHTDSRKIILSSASGKLATNRVCRCAFCGFTTRNFALLKIHINKNHTKITKTPSTDLTRLTNKETEIPLNLRKSTETTPNEALSLVTNKNQSAVSPSISSDDDSISGSRRESSGHLTVAGGDQQSPQLPMTYAMPQSPPHAGSFIMQPFLITQPDTEGSLTNDTFVPSLVYLPVSHKVLQPVRVAFNLTPA